jgi:hypothetical protein
VEAHRILATSGALGPPTDLSAHPQSARWAPGVRGLPNGAYSPLISLEILAAIICEWACGPFRVFRPQNETPPTLLSGRAFGACRRDYVIVGRPQTVFVEVHSFVPGRFDCGVSGGGNGLGLRAPGSRRAGFLSFRRIDLVYFDHRQRDRRGIGPIAIARPGNAHPAGLHDPPRFLSVVRRWVRVDSVFDFGRRSAGRGSRWTGISSPAATASRR